MTNQNLAWPRAAVVACLPSCADAANPPKYPTTTAGGHLREKFLSTQQAITYVE